MQLDEVIVGSEVPHIWVRVNSDGRLKTGNATREIPLLDAVRDLGFFDYVRRQKLGSGTRLFPDWERGGTAKDYSQAAWVRAFNRTVVKAMFDAGESSQLSLYSFRKCFKRLLIENDISPQIQDALMGHEPGQVERAYAGKISVDTTYPRVHALKYTGLEVGALEEGRGSRRVGE